MRAYGPHLYLVQFEFNQEYTPERDDTLPGQSGSKLEMGDRMMLG